jgi:hypothetical protein
LNVDILGVQIVQILPTLLALTTLLGMVMVTVLLWIVGAKRDQAARLAYARVYATGRVIPAEVSVRDFDGLGISVANRAPPTFQSRIGKQARLNQRV